jgi:hypothetical protein
MNPSPPPRVDGRALLPLALIHPREPSTSALLAQGDSRKVESPFDRTCPDPPRRKTERSRRPFVALAPPLITRHTMSSKFRSNSFKTKDGRPRQVSHFSEHRAPSVDGESSLGDHSRVFGTTAAGNFASK